MTAPFKLRSWHCCAKGLFPCGFLLVWFCSTSLLSFLNASPIDDTKARLLAGDYTGCITAAESAMKEELDRQETQEWQLVLTKALLAKGEIPRAQIVITNALRQDRWDLRVRWLAHEVFMSGGQTNLAEEMADRIIRAVTSHPRDYRDAVSLTIFGEAALVKGADPKRVLDTVFEAAKKADPKERVVYLATGNLALEKHDYALAAKRFEEGLKQIPGDPELHFGLARSFAPSDAPLMAVSAEATLAKNSNHVGTLLLLAEHAIDAEDYSGARELLDRVHTVNPWQPDAWSYRSVLGHLLNQEVDEKDSREKALHFWAANPMVDYLIGRKLSQKYLFAEGASHQRQALEFSPGFSPARAQLAQDLLRLGDESEGWRLISEVQSQDPYDVEAYNLATLKDVIVKFATLTNQHFIVRMAAREAPLYGERALALLDRAREKLSAKYGVQLSQPTTVEIFPDQKDFAVRTFGMPGNPGYLGVCFGPVITANSPAANPGHAVNWEAVLWHEFTHVITLQITKNRMPRWLSEGISVYEELQEHPAWGQRMTPQYREMVLEGELTPLSKLSGAFLSPKSDVHLQFAYYESSLVVEFLLKNYGAGKLQAILTDLGAGQEMNATLGKRVEPLETLEKKFETFVREKALNLAPGLGWDKPEVAGSGPRRSARRGPGRREPVEPTAPGGATEMLTGEAWESWAAARPTNYFVMKRSAHELVESNLWAEAKPVLEKLAELYPDEVGGESSGAMLAATHRALGETDQEIAVLSALAEKDDTALPAYVRLMELESARADWQSVTTNVQRYLAVNPLVPAPYRFLAQASEKSGDRPNAILAYRSLIQLEGGNLAELHFRLAQALHEAGRPEARRETLLALEEAPRYRAALDLLITIAAENGNEAPPAKGVSPGTP